MSATATSLDNRAARRLWLSSVGLATTPIARLPEDDREQVVRGAPQRLRDILAIVESLGYVQLDSIQNITRAHHHILWSRNQHYREPMLDALLGEQRVVFEHFSHDACVLPMQSYPWWRRQFPRMRERLQGSNGYHAVPDQDELDAVRRRIADSGPLCTSAFESPAHAKAMWSRPSHKRALDYLWFTGALATSHRHHFTKYYDLAERIIPDALRTRSIAETQQIDWLCRGALQRLVFATHGDLQRFWNAVSVAEARDWLARARHVGPVSVETAQGKRLTLHAAANLAERLADAPVPTSRLRIINPFDPAVRDRRRLRWLFGVDYRNEIFVPAARRRFGYYVYLLLEGDRFVGRLEARADRRAGSIDVCRLWSEPGVRWAAARFARLDAELARLARMIGVDAVRWTCAREAIAHP